MIDYNERTRRRAYLFLATAVVLFAVYTIYRHDRTRVKASKEMRQGMKVLTDPESLVKDLE